MYKNNYGELPDGMYVCDTIDITSGTNDDGFKTVLWKMIVVEGEYKDHPVNKYFTLRSEAAKTFLLKELRMVNLPVTKGDELEQRKSELFGKHITVEAKMNEQGYPSFYVKGLARAQNVKPTEAAAIEW